ncbi:hypothetical protein [Actinomadura sp. WAC 06369]|uniref:hypothetical protein n=1 Tax=Actinomadura sp. WAC 06369 TaxID=2203193 RepID=UPI000F77F79B|nr:hypothetical protein [Actinomadura sp. WAC 06369]RSN71323.1 hypothetical protein DMH08_02650 [Actinomadura sp. WAC 06369]
MVKQLERLGERLVHMVAPPVPAEAAAAACYNQYCCCISGCTLPWQNKIKYDRICDGVRQYSWETSCGACSA